MGPEVEIGKNQLQYLMQLMENLKSPLYYLQNDVTMRPLALQGVILCTVWQALRGRRHFNFLGEQIYHLYSNFQDMVYKQLFLI